MSDTHPPLTVSVGGLAGTGSSTLSRLLAEQLGLPYAYAGGIFREEAARRGLTLEAFNELCESDPAVDRSLDDRQVELLRAGGVLLEGRLAGWLATREKLGWVHRVWVVCDGDERFRRLGERDGGADDEVRERTVARETSELARFSEYYGADLGDLSIYDQVLDSTLDGPAALAAQVIAEMRAAGATLPAGT